jgi:hypothetical protein
MIALRALKALNRARRSASGSASDLQLAIDAADRAGGYDRSRNRPVRAPLQEGQHVRGNQIFNGRACRTWPHQPSCLCMVCGNLRRARLGVLRAQAEIAAGDFDVRAVLRRAGGAR